MGPVIASGLNYDDLLVRLKLNGEVKQEERTSQLIHSVPELVSFISRYVTLHPGDLISTGTSGRTGPMKPGDKVEVEIKEWAADQSGQRSKNRRLSVLGRFMIVRTAG